MHALLAAAAIAYTQFAGGPREVWGDPNSLGGGSVAITPVNKIALPSRGGLPNPVANDTESRVPRPAKPEPARTKQEDDAIAIKGREAKDKKTQTASKQKYSPPGQRDNQLTSSTGAAAASDMYGTTAAGSGVGVGPSSPFGTRYGYYAQILRDRVAQNWKTDQLDPRLKTAPMVIVNFEILRDGSVRDVRILQRSGNVELDYSCQRAIYDARPFPPLPPGFERNSAVIEFWFELKR